MLKLCQLLMINVHGTLNIVCQRDTTAAALDGNRLSMLMRTWME